MSQDNQYANLDTSEIIRLNNEEAYEFLQNNLGPYHHFILKIYTAHNVLNSEMEGERIRFHSEKLADRVTRWLQTPGEIREFFKEIPILAIDLNHYQLSDGRS